MDAGVQALYSVVHMGCPGGYAVWGMPPENVNSLVHQEKNVDILARGGSYQSNLISKEGSFGQFLFLSGELGARTGRSENRLFISKWGSQLAELPCTFCTINNIDVLNIDRILSWGMSCQTIAFQSKTILRVTAWNWKTATPLLVQWFLFTENFPSLGGEKSIDVCVAGWGWGEMRWCFICAKWHLHKYMRKESWMFFPSVMHTFKHVSASSFKQNRLIIM